MRAEQRLAVRTILQSQKNLQEKLAEQGPIKLEKTIDRRIKAHEEATESIKYRAGWKTVRSHLITAFVTIAVAIVIYKLTGK
jgi:cytochrome c-type biogenesis protein CcmH/NrfG